MWNLDLVGPPLGSRLMAPMPRGGRLGAALTRWLVLLLAYFNARLLQDLRGLLRAHPAQQAPQRRQRRLPILQQLGYVAQGADRRLQFLVPRFAQRFPYPL